MNTKLYIIFLIFIGCVAHAQDDSIEGVESEITNSKSLKQEENILKFKENFILGVQEQSKSNPKKALDYLNVCEELLGNDLALLYYKARVLYDLKNYDQALNYCDKLITIQSDFLWGLTLKRDILFAEQNFEDALSVQKKLYQLNINQTEDLLKLYIKLNDFNAANLLLTEVKQNATYLSNIKYYQNLINRKLNKPKSQNKKENTFKETITNDYQKLVTESQFEDLRNISEQAIYRNPTKPINYLYNGIALNKLKKPLKAAFILESGLDFVFNNKELKVKFLEELIDSYALINQPQKIKYYKSELKKIK